MKNENKAIELELLIEDYTKQKETLEFRISNLEHAVKGLKGILNSAKEEMEKEKDCLNRELELVVSFLKYLNKLK